MLADIPRPSTWFVVADLGCVYFLDDGVLHVAALRPFIQSPLWEHAVEVDIDRLEPEGQLVAERARRALEAWESGATTIPI